MAGFVLRVKTKSGQKVVNGLTPRDKVSELKFKLSELTGINIEMLHVLGGFPPKALDLANGKATLDETGITSGDTLIVEEKSQVIDNKIDDNADTPRSHIVNSESIADIPGVLMKKIVPADNSCLFTSVGYVLNGIIRIN